MHQTNNNLKCEGNSAAACITITLLRCLKNNWNCNVCCFCQSNDTTGRNDRLNLGKHDELDFFYYLQIIIFIIKGFWTVVFIFIVISTMLRLINPPVFFRCLSNSGTFMELRTTSFIESTGVACSDSINHNWVQVLSIPVLLLACS